VAWLGKSPCFPWTKGATHQARGFEHMQEDATAASALDIPATMLRCLPLSNR